jgi:hypothetical protein
MIAPTTSSSARENCTTPVILAIILHTIVLTKTYMKELGNNISVIFLMIGIELLEPLCFMPNKLPEMYLNLFWKTLIDVLQIWLH